MNDENAFYSIRFARTNVVVAMGARRLTQPLAVEVRAIAWYPVWDTPIVAGEMYTCVTPQELPLVVM